MGSFNYTCAVSDLPIHYGDEVVVFLIVRNRYWSPEKPTGDYIYSNAEWELLGFPFVAKYADYGWIEDEENSIYLDWTLNQIKKRLIERPWGKNSVRDVPVSRDEVNLEKINEWVTDDRLWLDNRYWSTVSKTYKTVPPYAPVNYMLIHKQIYDDLINNCHPDMDYNRETKTYSKWDMDYYKSQFNEYVEVTNKKEEKYAKILASKSDENSEDSEELKKIVKEWLKLNRYDTRHLFPSTHHLFTIYDENKTIDTNDLADKLAQIAAFDLTMNGLWKKYKPSSYAGQGETCEQMIVLIESMNKVMEKRKRYMGEDEDDGDEQ